MRKTPTDYLMGDVLKCLAVCVLAYALITVFVGCQATAPDRAAEVAKWQQTADFYAERLTAVRQLIELEPPGPKRDALVRDLQRVEWLYKFAQALTVGPTTQPAK